MEYNTGFGNATSTPRGRGHSRGGRGSSRGGRGSSSRGSYPNTIPVQAGVSRRSNSQQAGSSRGASTSHGNRQHPYKGRGSARGTAQNAMNGARGVTRGARGTRGATQGWLGRNVQAIKYDDGVVRDTIKRRNTNAELKAFHGVLIKTNQRQELLDLAIRPEQDAMQLEPDLAPNAKNNQEMIMKLHSHFMEQEQSHYAFKLAVANRFEVINELVANLQIELQDAERQTSKYCLILGGRDVPPPPKTGKEKDNRTFQIFADLVYKKWDIDFPYSDVMDCHRLSRNIIVKFNTRVHGSAFHMLTIRTGNWNGTTTAQQALHLYLEQRLSTYDQFIKIFLQVLKFQKKINNFRTCLGGWNTFKYTKDGKWFPARKYLDIKHMLTANVWDSVINKFKTQGGVQANDLERFRKWRTMVPKDWFTPEEYDILNKPVSEEIEEEDEDPQFEELETTQNNNATEAQSGQAPGNANLNAVIQEEVQEEEEEAHEEEEVIQEEEEASENGNVKTNDPNDPSMSDIDEGANDDTEMEEEEVGEEEEVTFPNNNQQTDQTVAHIHPGPSGNAPNLSQIVRKSPAASKKNNNNFQNDSDSFNKTMAEQSANLDGIERASKNRAAAIEKMKKKNAKNNKKP